MKYYFTIILQLFLSASLAGQSIPSFSFVNESMESYTIDFKEINNLVVLPISVNNSDTLYFVLDSGAENIILFGSEFDTPPIDTNQLRQVNVGGLGSDETIEAYVSANNILNIGGIKGSNQSLIYIDDDFLKFSDILGQPIHGIIGVSIFHSFLVQINYYRKKITFYSPQKSIRKRRYTKIDLTMINDRPYIEMDIEIHPRINLITNLLLDLGESKPMSLYLNSHELIFLPEPNYYANLGKGLNGMVTGRVGTIHGVRLKRFQLNDVLTAFPNEADIRHVVDIETRNGSLGAGIIKQFISLFDLSNAKLYLRRGSLLKHSFKFDKTGLVIVSEGENYDQFLITGVIEGTAGYRAGLEIGDKIISIDAEEVQGKKLGDVIKFIEDGGRRLSIKVLRNGEKKSFVLRIFKL